MQELLNQPHLFHLYLKYLRSLMESDVNLVKDITNSYSSVLDMLNSEPDSGLSRQVGIRTFILSKEKLEKREVANSLNQHQGEICEASVNWTVMQ